MKETRQSQGQSRPESEIRLDKLEQLKKLGINPYPSVTPEYITIEEVRGKKDGAKVATVGRLTSIRKHGKIAFLDLVHEEHKIQLFSSLDNKEVFELIDLLDTGDYVWVSGELFTTKAGELTLKADSCQLLAKSLLPIPEGWHSLEDVETRYRQRALDFKTNPEARKIIATRSKIVGIIRDFFVRHGFIEIHTPVLQPIPGGATAKPFTTHYNALDADFYLRVAPELYLKRLIAGGFERVFEIGPLFRNEGLSHMHNPEFYSCEAYWAYQEYFGFMKATQDLVQELLKKVCGGLKITYQGQSIDFSNDFPIKKYAELIKEDTGIDIEKEATFKLLKKATESAGIKFEGQKITVWSELVDELFKKVSRPKIVQPIFLIDHPIETTPLAKQGRDNPKIAERFQLICCGGFEVTNAYTELNDPIDQEARFKEQAKMSEAGWDEAQMLDENFVEALKFGMPPTCGWAIGIERITMILTDQHSIKEVIPFPTLRPKP
ncbi:MAG: lysine--tRNA ligase [bacterium]|nr:lysine--tRNA ligase [bacterium]